MREGLTKEEAVFWEVYYIAKIGRKDLATGPLLNRKEGGEGELVSDELRQQISEKVAALWAAGVFAAINSPEAIKRRSYNRQANKAAELKVDLDTYLGLDKCKRDQFVQWRKENPEADWKEFFDTRRSATAAARYQVPLEIWENLDAKQKNALKEYCNNIPGRSGMDWLAGVRAVGGPKPKVDPKQVRRLRDEGLTNTQIAKQLNCTQPTISRILSGKRQRARQALAA